jgi:hypothetical protein
VSVVIQRSGNSAGSLTSSSSSAPVNSYRSGPETCPPNWGNPRFSAQALRDGALSATLPARFTSSLDFQGRIILSSCSMSVSDIISSITSCSPRLESPTLLRSLFLFVQHV